MLAVPICHGRRRCRPPVKLPFHRELNGDLVSI
jgi:hypothetical protein